MLRIPFILLFLPALALAHGPSRQKVVKDIEVNAPPEQVWAIIADFCSITTWNPEISACEASAGNQPDNLRTLTFSNGAQIQDKLARYKPEQMLIQFVLVQPNTKAMPVNTLGSTLSVAATEYGRSRVQWKTAFYRAFPGASPPPELSDEAAITAVAKLLDAGLHGIKSLAEQ